MDEYVDVKIDIFEHTGQRAKLRRTLTISGLIDEVLKEFDDVSADSVAKYAVYLKGIARALTNSATIAELDLQPQDELVFEYKRQQNIREMLQPQDFAILRDETTGKNFDIQWQPALIGRPTAEADHNLKLAVNVESIPKGMTISRTHAQITFSDDHYYIEPLAENNPIFLNEKEMPFGSMWEIKSGDKLTLGRFMVTLTFMKQPQGTPPPRETKSQTIPPVISQPKQPQPKQEEPAQVRQPEPIHPLQAQPVESQPIYQAVPPPSISDQSPVVGVDLGGTVLEMSEILPSYLVIEKATTAEQVGQRIEITEYPFTIGRVLPILSAENGVSRRHAEVNFDPQTRQFTFTDLKSTNGATLEGVEILTATPYEIKSGTRFGLGQDVVLIFGV